MAKRLFELVNLDGLMLDMFLRGYNVGDLISFGLCHGGMVNTNYFLKTTMGQYLLRIYSGGRTEEAIEFEISVLNRLSGQGFPCQEPIKNSHGIVLSNLKGHRCCLMTFIPGESLSAMNLSLGHLEEVGRLVGRMQKLLTGFVPDGRKENADFISIQSLTQETIKTIQKMQVLTSLAAVLADEWKEVSAYFAKPRVWEMGVVHADLSLDNIIGFQESIQGIIDFDDCYIGWLLGDVALAIMEFAFDDSQSINLKFAQAILRGFLTERPMSPKSLKALVPFMRLLSFKFLGYTLPLAQGDPVKTEENTYVRRILALKSPQLRSQIEQALEDCFMNYDVKR